jgi:hypothetical protein
LKRQPSAKLQLLLTALALLGTTTRAQSSDSGSVTVTVLDPTGALVPGAELQLKSQATNDVRGANTQSNGAFSFSNLPFGEYQLQVSKTGFDTQLFQSVAVQIARVTSLKVTLRVGGTSQEVQVTETAAPLVETDSSVLADTIDTKQVVNLPMLNRNVMSLAFLVPGWSSTGANSSNGTWNNMPGGAVVGADFDGTPGISNRFRSGGFNYGTTAAQPRIEDVAEMTIQTGQLDLSGSGTSAMRIAIVGRHGTNQFHGRLFEDFRNTDLQANSWINNARGLPRGNINLNDFGGNIGGPVLKNKLFFFGTWSQSIRPGVNNSTVTVLTPEAQQGIFKYRDSAGVLQTVNVLQLAGKAGFPATLNPNTASQLQKISGVFSQGTLTPQTDPNLETLAFQAPQKTTVYYPTVRGDYVFSEKVRMNLSYSQTKSNGTRVNAPAFPGGIDDQYDYTSSNSNNRIAGFGLDWIIRPAMINSFHAGYMYQYQVFDPESLGIDLPNIHQETWNYAQSLYGGPYPRLPISSFYPLLSANDSFTWQRGSHSFSFGGSWWREQDHYWNGPGGNPRYTFGINGQDPVSAVFTSAFSGAPTTALTNAENLYAQLVGRVSQVNISVGRPLDPATKQYKPFGAYNLNEVTAAAGFWLQDRWRARRNLTVNYGIRWDIVGDDHDIDGGYSTLPTLGDLWGPTPVGAIFQPGKLGGVASPNFVAQVHAYDTSWNNPSPAIGIAWSPDSKLLGQGKTVIRAGYSLRHYTEGAQNIWAYASNAGQFFFQSGQLTPNTAVATGNFQPGSLTYGDPLPPYQLTPATYSPVVPATNLFAASTFRGLNPHIGQPYVEQWNLGIQRELGSLSALEVRYVGNLSLHQWLAYNINETNIFENGFLQEFTNAQNNLKINQSNGKGNTFANNGLPGQVPLPIFAAAFGSATSNYTNGTFITNLTTGAAGALANGLANNATFYCNLVGTANFSAPCISRGVTNAPGGGYPINFFNVNPYATGRNVFYLDAAGHTNYHGLQVEFRQRAAHGAQFNVNYTWAHSLGIATQNGIQGEGNNIYYTARNFRLNYGPSLFDIRHVVHASGTYDLPFGKNKRFANRGGALDQVVGGWTLGTIITIQSGTPAILGGGYNTVNNTDAGILFTGATAADLQSSVGVYRSGNPWVQTVDPKFIASNGSANATYLGPANQPGVWGYRPTIYGPSWYNIDLSINKGVSITERVRFVLQAQFLNATNHPTFALPSIASGFLSVQSLSFLQSTSGPTGPRVVELRANIEF